MKCIACELNTKPIFRSLYSVIRATSSSVFLLQLNITRFEYNLYLLAITHRLPEFSCAVSDIKNYIKAMQLNSLKVEALTKYKELYAFSQTVDWF